MQNPRDWGKKKTEKGEIVHNNKYCLREVSTKKYPGTGQLFELKQHQIIQDVIWLQEWMARTVRSRIYQMHEAKVKKMEQIYAYQILMSSKPVLVMVNQNKLGPVRQAGSIRADTGVRFRLEYSI